MDWQNRLIFGLFFMVIRRARLTGLPPPQHIEVNSSALMWEPAGDGGNVTYTVQYSTEPVGQWASMTGCSLLKCDLAAEEDVYGKVFRVRAERGGLFSEWRQSEQVQCAHIGTCAPLINLTVKTDKVHLWMTHKDQSLKKEFGVHIIFRPLYWKAESPKDKQEPEDITNPLIISGLEPGKNYCFQVEYLRYHKPYGTPSDLFCREIPETSSQRKLRIIISGVLTVVGLIILGSWLYFVHKNSKKIKQYLQPPLDIPQHFQEFFSMEFSEHRVDLPSSHDTEVCNSITFASEQTQEDLEMK